ncbi:MAG: hypothetical protein L0I24_20525 [Pseudonocardia sp.]|nr:hypothetical protein [Pseudonocardia sp.]
MNARWESLVRSLATDNGWAYAWLWVGYPVPYPVPALWAAGASPADRSAERSSGGSSASAILPAWRRSAAARSTRTAG